MEGRPDLLNSEETIASYEKRIYDLEQLLDISRSFSTTMDGSKLLDSITFSCMAQMHVTNAGIFVLDLFDSENFELQGNREDSEKKILIPSSDPVIDVLADEMMPMTVDYIRENVGETEGLKILADLNPTLVIPLTLKNHINGILFLGERFLLDPDSSLEYTEYEKDLILNIADLAAIAINNTALIERSSTDMMTQLKLKYFFFNVLTEKLDNANSNKSPLSVLMFDIDFFKHFNDTYGHECGDYVLKQVAHLIKSNLRDEDLASRYGGEEFTVLLDNTKKNVAMAIAERIRSSIASHDFVYNDLHMKVTISVGVAVYDYRKNRVISPLNLVNQADQGLYMSKHNGRNRVTYADPTLVTNLEE